jgi:hypothetical protein
MNPYRKFSGITDQFHIRRFKSRKEHRYTDFHQLPNMEVTHDRPA